MAGRKGQKPHCSDCLRRGSEIPQNYSRCFKRKFYGASREMRKYSSVSVDQCPFELVDRHLCGERKRTENIDCGGRKCTQI